MNILVGVDESPFSEAAVEFVKGMSWPKGTRVRVVSASPPIFPTAGELAMPDVIAQVITQQDQFHRELAERAAQTLRDAGLACEAAMVSGDPRSTLVEEAKRSKTDLLVVGSHGRTGLGRVLLGSVAAHVASHAPCSVTIVKRSPSTPNP